MTDYESMPSAFIVKPKGAEIFDERATSIYIEEEGAGMFLVLKQSSDEMKPGQIAIDPEEWPHIDKAVRELIRVIREQEKGKK